MKPLSSLVVGVVALLLLVSTGCQSHGGFNPQSLGQFGQMNAPLQGQNYAGFAQQAFNPNLQQGSYQQPVSQQPSLGQLGQNISRRIGNGFLNQAISRVVGLAF